MEYFDPSQHQPDNERLRTLLIALSDDRTPDLRKEFYKRLLTAELLVLYRPEGEAPNLQEPTGEVTLISFLDENGDPVMPVFTETDIARGFARDDDQPFGMQAREIFQLALNNDIQHVVFDPGKPYMLALNGYEMQELSKGMIPVGQGAIHRIDSNTEYSLGPASTEAPNPQFRTALLQALEQQNTIIGAYLFYLGTAERPPELTLGFLFHQEVEQGEMMEVMNSLFEATGPYLDPEDELNVMPLTDEEMESRLFAMGAQIFYREK